MDDAPDFNWRSWSAEMESYNRKIRSQLDSLEETISKIQGSLARIMFNDMNRDPERRQAYLDTLHNPDNEISEIDKRIIEMLLEQEKNGENL